MTRQPHPDRPARLAVLLQRDGPSCVWCGRRLGGLVAATTDHLVPRVKGGPAWLENEAAACRRCNRERGHLSRRGGGRREGEPDGGRREGEPDGGRREGEPDGGRRGEREREQGRDAAGTASRSRAGGAR